MATFETTRPAPFGAEILHRAVSYIDELREALVEWNNHRVTRNAIARLSDRELNDIGLSRADVDAMPRGSRRF